MGRWNSTNGVRLQIQRTSFLSKMKVPPPFSPVTDQKTSPYPVLPLPSSTVQLWWTAKGTVLYNTLRQTRVVFPNFEQTPTKIPNCYFYLLKFSGKSNPQPISTWIRLTLFKSVLTQPKPLRSTSLWSSVDFKSLVNKDTQLHTSCTLTKELGIMCTKEGNT